MLPATISNNSKPIKQRTNSEHILSVAAHELKNPIASLKLFAQLYISRAHGNGDLYNIKLTELQFIDSVLDRLNRLINNLLYPSGVFNGETKAAHLHYTLRLEDASVSEIIEDVLKEVELIAGSHQIFFKNKFGGVAVIDKDSITQVLINILSNAIKYSPDGSKIKVTCQKFNNSLLVAIKDYGIGIPKEKQKYIFDKYYKVHGESKDSLGLGLYFVKEIIKFHKGKIWMESKTGKGSTFFFTLPLSQ